jgi:RNA polymerase sigma-70 factor (ECF subfamily)
MNKPDAQLVNETLQGNSAAFGDLMRRYQDRLFTAMLYLTNCHSEAEDVVQEAFLCAYKKLETFAGRATFYTWIYRIAVRRALTRKRRRRPQTNAAEADLFSERASARDDPARPLQLAETIDSLRRAVANLDEHQRAVVLLRDYEGFDSPTIAHILGIPEGTVRSRLHRARNRLRHELKDLMATTG